MNGMGESYRYLRPGVTRTDTYADWRQLRSWGWTAGQAWKILRDAVMPPVPEPDGRCECGHQAVAHPYQSGPGDTWWDGCLAVGCECGAFRPVSS